MPYKNPEDYKKWKREYEKKKYWKNPELAREKNRKRHKTEKYKKWARKYFREYWKEYSKRPEVKERNNIRSYAYNRMREEKLRQQPNCEMCGTKENLHLHHEKYESLKGYKCKHDLDMIRVYCQKCHIKIHKEKNERKNINAR